MKCYRVSLLSNEDCVYLSASVSYMASGLYMYGYQLECDYDTKPQEATLFVPYSNLEWVKEWHDEV